jgi:hypothetical protein
VNFEFEDCESCCLRLEMFRIIDFFDAFTSMRVPAAHIGHAELDRSCFYQRFCRRERETQSRSHQLPVSSSLRTAQQGKLIFQIILGNLNLSDHSRKPQSFRSFYIAPDTRLCVVPPNTTKPYTQRCGRSRNSPDTFHQREKEHLPNFCWQRHPIDTEYEAAP